MLQGGVPRKHWDVLRREVLHTYGHEHVLTLAALQDAGRAVPIVIHEGRLLLMKVGHTHTALTEDGELPLQVCSSCSRVAGLHFQR